MAGPIGRVPADHEPADAVVQPATITAFEAAGPP
jgi:hypothetical protein